MNRLTRGRYQGNTTSSCTGEQYFPFHLTRSGEEWFAAADEDNVRLKAHVGDEPNQPPSTGWQYTGGGGWKGDEYLKCTIPVSSPTCCLTVTLSGPAKEAQGKCEGTYRSTGLISSGRPVKLICMNAMNAS